MGYYTKYYTLGLPSFLIITIALYLLFTGMYVCTFLVVWLKYW